MRENRPKIQEYLIDHLLRIVQGVSKTGPDENGIVEWGFGFGEDALATYQPSSPENQKEWNEQGREWKKDVQLELDGLLLAIEAGDHMRIPERLVKLRRKREFGSIPLDEVVALGEAWAKLETLTTKEEAYEIAYAYEALKKLEDMVNRGPQVTEKRHLLPKVSRWVNRYMSEAASCYRYGFDLACVSLCRFALEEALKDRLSKDFGSEAIKQCEPGKGKRERVLTDLIEMAARYNLLDPQLKKKACAIKTSGNECAHGKLKGRQVRQVALDALADSRLIIQCVYSGDSKL